MRINKRVHFVVRLYPGRAGGSIRIANVWALRGEYSGRSSTRRNRSIAQ